MTLSPGTRLGPYEVASPLGAGGMGEVYRARDTKLNRDVALKVLPEAFAADPDRLMRFTREAHTLASLNHPNIAQIYGIEDRAIAMELVEGEDLSVRSARGPIPLAEALPIARQIGEALEAAHDQGIIHRDLKPANIKIRDDGTVKVLDFGLAKALDSGSGLRDQESGGAANSPTITTPAMTAMGMILGTAAYMSPEQARGKTVDKRADVWAFGCVLYEMLTGRRAFEAEDVSLTLSKVLQRDPDFDAFAAEVPPRVRQAIRLCLQKPLRERIPDIASVRLVLEGAFETAAPAPAAVVPQPQPARRGWLVGALGLALVAGAALGRWALAPGPPPAQAFEFDVTIPGSTIEQGSFSLSPDGSRLALVVRDKSGARQLAVRGMNLTEARVLPGTTGAAYPFWSPDGREIAFFVHNQLSRVALDGAAARPIATIVDPRGGAWASSGIMLVGSGAGPIVRIPASGGGQPEPVTTVETGVEGNHAWPALLPDGKRFVFLADAPTDAAHRIRLGRIEGGPTTILKSPVNSQPVVDPAGRLLFVERGQLLAYEFDLASGAVGNESTLLATEVFAAAVGHELPVSAARGMVAFQNASMESSLVMLDLAGKVTKTIGEPARYGNVTASPDQRHVAFELTADSREQSIWIQNLERGVRTLVSHRGKSAWDPTWSPDGQSVYFDSDAKGKWEAYRVAVSGGGEPESLGLPDKAGEVDPLDVSPDGRWLLGKASMGANQFDLYLRALDGSGDTWTAWLAGSAREDWGAFSNDSRWIAYTSDISGRAEVYVAPLEGGPSVRRWQVSSAGGAEPRFSPDGNTIYYLSPTLDWMAVDVRMDAGNVRAGTPRALFSLPPMEVVYLRNRMDVLPDGSGFVTLQPVSRGLRPIRVRTGR